MIGLIILVALPLIEIAVLIKTGQWLGVWPVIGIVVATFLLGSAILGRSGLTAAIKVREALSRGEEPVGAMMDSAMVVLAAILLITPGLIADAVGLLLLVPPVRRLLAHLVLRNAVVVGSIRTGHRSYDDPHSAPPFDDPPRPSRSGDGPLIEGEFERLDERPVDGRSRRDPGERS
jgi:UPF0716 protein FxsA